MTERLVPAGSHMAEITVVNSRFIASVGPAASPEAARAFIQEIKNRYKDASHHVPAFILGHGLSVIEHCHDDGEPQGTAGRPVLAVLRGSGLGDIAMVVTRYFGGTKLGTGGLVRAYSDAARAGLEHLPLARKASTQTLMAAMPYSLFERARQLVVSHEGLILDEAFAADVTLTARFLDEQADRFRAALFELSHGSVTAETVSREQDTLLPIGD